MKPLKTTLTGLLQFIILSKTILKSISNLLPKSRFSQLITNFIANQMVLPWNVRQHPLQPMHLFVFLKNSGFLISCKIFVLTFIGSTLMNIFVTFNSHEQLIIFVEYMNTKHANMKVTFEHEHNISSSFLDVKIYRKNNKTKHFCVEKTHIYWRFY